MTVDRYDRPLTSLRLSVTDRCNLRCSYCMPEEEYAWLEKSDVLSFEELARLSRVFASLGVSRLRLTGGEPLLRRDLSVLVRMLAAVPGVEDLALTTNGVRLVEHAAALRAAGLTRLTVSLDTLDRERFERLTRRDEIERVFAGVEAARDAGFDGTKLDTVVVRGLNDDELVPLLDFARDMDCELRFIEYMDVAGATAWKPETVVSRDEILDAIGTARGRPEPIELESWAPARRYRLPDGTVFGIVASTTAPFCATCDRVRLTADGVLLTCLYARQGLDLRAPLRAGEDDAALAARVTARWSARDDRGAEERFAQRKRGEFVPLEDLRADPHLEMHTRGG